MGSELKALLSRPAFGPLSRYTAALLVTLLVVCDAPAGERELRVCSDPNNLPFSNESGEGFENAIASILADEFGARLSYTWWAQRRGFIRNTLDAGTCDLVIGVPADYELVETTESYYRSSYVFVHRPEVEPRLQSMLDPRLRSLRIGVHLTGDDGANPPPAHALGRQGIVDNVVGYMIYGDYREPNPPARVIEAVGAGALDAAAVWGPVGAYFARKEEPPLEVHVIRDTEAFARLPFEFSIAMGVRKGEFALRDEIQNAIDARADQIQAVLGEFGVPLVPPTTAVWTEVPKP